MESRGTCVESRCEKSQPDTNYILEHAKTAKGIRKKSIIKTQPNCILNLYFES
jgi:hypothetical protein